ncbi:YheC/YheD family protein [Bacillus sp. FJAT-27251]|uniref:YheC/YheD family protein n=1 Tax=Bacillus sp. FJAT-27251 TaxID=1684142 RepID=UPI0006A7EB98|nr:YheC/YheD family protein [Bacillus sp. FJAT-27251]
MISFEKLASKWQKTKVLKKNFEIKDYLPETKWLNKKNLKSMLQKHQAVFVKPSRGTGGVGVIKVETGEDRDERIYTYHHIKKTKTFKTIGKLYFSLKKKIDKIQTKSKRGQGRYMIQQGVPLLKYENRSFDIRVIVQLNKKTKKWESAGMLARVAHPAKIVTNYSSSGTPMKYEQVMASFLSKEEIPVYKEQLENLVVKMANELSAQCNQLQILGFDIGYDENIKPWLIEVNLEPRFKSFKITDMETYEKIESNFTGYRGEEPVKAKPIKKRSKWKLKNVLEKQSEFRQHVPETQWFNHENLSDMLDRHQMVYVKPDNWSMGRGVFRVERVKNEDGSDRYMFQRETKVYSFDSFAELFASLDKQIKDMMKKRKTKNKKCLIQKGIHLLKYEGRIFDFRVLVQRTPDHKFEVTGMAGRVAQSQRVVTNIANHGQGYQVEPLLAQYMSDEQVQAFKIKLKELGEKIAPIYNLDAIGIDIGVDRDFFPWIIEVNIWPNLYGFDELEDKTMFNRIMEIRNYWKNR